MRLWRKASGLLKDKNSIWIVKLSRRTSFRNPDIEAAVIKATSHDEFNVNMKNFDRIYKWLRLSPTHFRILIRAISIRMEKTRNWVVAIKGLMLMHGVFSLKLPAVQRIGRLPFDLSSFKDGHSNSSKIWGLNALIRSYFLFLDQKSSMIYMNLQERRSLQNMNNNSTMVQDLVSIQKLQSLLDLLLKIRPLSDSAIVPLVIEALDCVMIEVFDVYSKICNGVARVLLRIYSSGKVEASMALKIMKKANIQGQELSLFFEIWRDIGVRNAKECPRIERIPDEDFKEIEEIINGASQFDEMAQTIHEEEEEEDVEEKKGSESKLMTIITDSWETFDEEKHGSLVLASSTINVPVRAQELPDLISFL